MNNKLVITFLINIDDKLNDIDENNNSNNTMWQVANLFPKRITDAISQLVRYAQESINIFLCVTP